MNRSAMTEAAQWFLRVAQSASLLSAVADRFGLWGPPGSPNVAWGDWRTFEEYVAKLNWFAPQSTIFALAWAATLAEILVGLGLLAGWHLRWVAFAGGLLLLSFAVTMTIALGIQSAFGFLGVWSRGRSVPPRRGQREERTEFGACRTPVSVADVKQRVAGAGLVT